MNFIETRGNEAPNPRSVTFSEAIRNPSASYGGLYVPESLPTLDEAFFQNHKNGSYEALARDLLQRFEIDIDEEVIDEALRLYRKFDDPNDPTPVAKVKEDLFVIELYHGPTRAFKDMALQPFGHILSDLAHKRDEHYLILAATSGDTGPATLDSFADKPNIRIACLYPSGGTSDVQRLQMVTEAGKNLKVIGIEGNFDDAQSALKRLLASPAFKARLDQENIRLSAANSVNFGRIIFQIVYHIRAYLDLLERGEIMMGEKIYLTIPSGNFGNALGAYYAKKMGLPVEKILIASNANNILTELITDGRYDLRGKRLLQTTSPAMDILKSSNVERVLFDKFGAERTRALMEQLAKEEHYALTSEELAALREDFDAVYSDDAYAKAQIAAYARQGYVMDPHTATCIKAYETLKRKPLKMVIASTAEWTKFAPTMLNALREDDRTYSDLEALHEVSKMLGIPITPSVLALFDKPILHNDVVPKERIEEAILDFITA